MAAGRFRDRALRELLLDYPLRPAKSLRPALMFAATEALGASADAAVPSAAALELYHNAFLIHDDVEDASVLRRSAPTLHTVHGSPVAINTGDSMMALALETLLVNTEVLGVGRALRVLSIFAKMSRVTVEGQNQELAWIREGHWNVSRGEYLRMVHRKTAWYSFVTPLAVGAVIGRASPESTRALVLGAARMGIAFQIADDLLSLAGDPEVVGKDALGDLHEGKRTLILLVALSRCSDDDRERALKLLSRAAPSALSARLSAFSRRHGLPAELEAELTRIVDGGARTADEVDWLAALVAQTKATDAARAVAQRLVAQSKRDLRRALAGRSGEAVDFLLEIGDYAVERTH